MARIDLEKFRELVSQRYLTVRRHQEADLLIWNYSKSCQYDNFWIPETKMARGLITDPDGNILSRPFPKFFNLGQTNDPLPDEPFEVFEKMDGSLGIMYYDGSKWCISTRGSFDSPMAIEATNILHDRYSTFDWDTSITLLFEIIYPENRIVIDYGDLRDLILLAAVHTETGEEYDIYSLDLPFTKVKKYEGIDDIYSLAKHDRDGEGYVIKYASDYRVKVKLAEYLRLHRLMFGISARRIWEMLSAGDSPEKWMQNVPDEFHKWVKKTTADINGEFESKLSFVESLVEKYKNKNKGETAQEVEKLYGKTVQFWVVRGMQGSWEKVKDSIWKEIKPKHETPFMEETDES